MRIAVIGASGQLGHDLVPTLRERGHEAIGLTHADIEVTDPDSVRQALTAAEPELVINTAAYHKVDEVEDNPDRAFAVNATGVRNLAIACRELDAPLMHLSTDYVFSGSKGEPYVESDPVDPINVYGVSKAAGEMLLRYLWPKHFIVRTSGLYGHAGSSGKGGNFVETMLRIAGEGRTLRVVDDQTLTPTSTRVLATQITVLIGADVYGTYHATCSGACTWYGFAAEIFRASGLAPELLPQTSVESGALAARPSCSVLTNAGLGSCDMDVLPDWREALAEYLQDRAWRRE